MSKKILPEVDASTYNSVEELKLIAEVMPEYDSLRVQVDDLVILKENHLDIPQGLVGTALMVQLDACWVTFPAHWPEYGFSVPEDKLARLFVGK